MLADVGCNVPRLDEHDRRVIKETRTGTTTYKGSKSGLPGLPDSQEDVGGWEDYPEVHRPAGWDTDGDGMPDAWETQQGHDLGDGADGAVDPDGDGYTNLEDYLNGLAAGSPAQPATGAADPEERPSSTSGSTPDGRYERWRAAATGSSTPRLPEE